VKFTPRGGRVEIALRRADSHVDIVVTDTGQGIAAPALPHLFERFQQVETGSSRSHGGLGLGLALVRHLEIRDQNVRLPLLQPREAIRRRREGLSLGPGHGQVRTLPPAIPRTSPSPSIQELATVVAQVSAR
jgi:hypothetical protein